MNSQKVDLYYECLGEGEPLLIIHGGPGLDHSYLLPALAPLAERHLLFFYDQRCTGQSTGTPTAETITLNFFLQDISALQKGLAFEKIHLLGHSWGALLALAYAKAYPEGVASLALLHPLPSDRESLRKLVDATLAKLSAADQEALAEITSSEALIRKQQEALNRYFCLWLKPYFSDPVKASSLTLISHERTAANCLAVNALMWAHLQHADLLKGVASLSCPICIVEGADDLVSTPALHKALPQAHSIKLPACGHFSFLEAPEALFAQLETFWTQTHT